MKKTITLVILQTVFIGFIIRVKGQETGDNEMEDMFVHPFMAHMAMPDKPGEMSLRVTPFQQRQDSITEFDLAMHIETGILPGLGIHIRNDGIKTSPYSEFMVMYSFLHNESLSNGLSVFGQVSIPTGPVESNALKYLFGVSGRWTIPRIMVMDANMHFDVADKMAEYESSFVFRASKLLYPSLEIRGEITGNGVSAYSLTGLKFRIADEMGLGVGFQFPLTREREYDMQTLFTFGIAF